MLFRFRWLLAIVFIVGCVEPFDPGIDSYEDVLVVDGILSTGDDPVHVIISRTFSYEQYRTNPETGAYVIIRDDKGGLFELTEREEGHYYYNGSDLSPEPGRSYQLYIMTADGSEYESDYQEMLVAASFDEAFFREYRMSTDGSFSGMQGVEFYINSSGEEDNRYYRWEWEESWKVLSPINYPDVRYCWQFSNSFGIHIATTENLQANSLENEFVYRVPFTNNKLAIEYSILLKQFAITRDNYIYLTKLQKINEGSGGFFDPIPAALSGNINCITEPDEPVLGFFEASTVESKRLFIAREDLSFGYIATGFEDCETIYVSFSEYSEGNIRNFFYVYEYFDSQLNDTIVVMTNYRKCSDCSYVGDPSKPDYWR